MFDATATYTLTAPASVDGRGAIAILNGSTAAGNWVGYLNEITRSVDVRSAVDVIPQGHGVIMGSSWYGAATYTLDVSIGRITSWAATFACRDKLLRATNAMASDLTVAWTEATVAYSFSARREQYPTGPDKDGKMLVALMAKDPRYYGATVAPSTSTTATNNGNADTPPTFVLTPNTASTTVVLTNSTTSKTLSLLVGTGYLVNGTSYTVNVANKTITRTSDGVAFPQAYSFPTSEWWELAPGANTWSVTNVSAGTTITFAHGYL